MPAFGKTEVANAHHVELCLENKVDVLWIGARTTVNPFQVQEIADSLKGVDVPVMVKNPINAELGLWLGAIERLYHAGIRKLASHIGGSRRLIEPISQMALDFGIQGLMIETHIDPDHALSDSKQQIMPTALMELLDRLHARGAEITDKQAKSRIARLRSEISHVDSKIIEDLSERMRWVEEIGKLKQQHNISVLQLNRWENLLEDHIAKAQKAGLDTDFIKAVFELIHAQAVKRQL
ncbi:MAG: chorismate mutase [Planctomycetota bacterium]